MAKAVVVVGSSVVVVGISVVVVGTSVVVVGAAVVVVGAAVVVVGAAVVVVTAAASARAEDEPRTMSSVVAEEEEEAGTRQWHVSPPRTIEVTVYPVGCKYQWRIDNI